eukprot:112151_1
MVNTYCNNKIFVKINFTEIENKFDVIYNILCGKSDYIKCTLLNIFFPNLEHIEIKNINLNKYVLDNILECVTNQAYKSKVNKIIIKSISKSDLKVSKAIMSYKQQFQKSGFDVSQGKRKNILSIQKI